MTPKRHPGGNILVAADDERRPALARTLEAAGYAVRLAGNGREALALLATPPLPDLILLDLPVLSGAEFRQRQLRDPALAPVPLVVLAPEGMTETFGGVACLRKPVADDQLLAAVERFITPRLPAVLVVEDEEAVRKLLDVALRQYGFCVWQAAGGAQAVELYSEHRDAIDLDLLDVRMPGMDGAETLTALRKLDPLVRAAFMSGNTGDYSVEQLLDLGAAHVLPKPFGSLEELARTLRRVADRSPTEA